jgi:hypothetical protein
MSGRVDDDLRALLEIQIGMSPTKEHTLCWEPCCSMATTSK